MQIKIDYKPNAKQYLFHKSAAQEVVYGGAKGGGKSYGLIFDALAYGLKYPRSEIYLFRRTYDDLKGSLIKKWIKNVPAAIYSYNKSEHTATLISGSIINFRYCASETDATSYKGRDIDYIGVDELTEHDEAEIQELISSLRSPSGYPTRFRGTCNPGGIGHTWVKNKYVTDTHKGDISYIDEKTGNKIVFIPALVYDNVDLMQKDPTYARRLENLAPTRRKAYLEGDWDIFEGQYFTEWNYDLHVSRPFEIPANWRRYVALDYGFDMLACYWAAFDPRGRGVVYRELHKSNMIVSEAAAEIKRLSEGEQITQYLSPPDLRGRQKDSGKSIIELFGDGGIYLSVVSAERIAGWYNLREWLQPITAPDGGKECRLQIFSNCSKLIEYLPMLQMDKQNPNDCAAEPHEITHAPDALRYLLSGRPAPGAEIPKNKEWLPVALRTPEKIQEVATWS